VGIDTVGTFAGSGGDAPVPIASVAKVMTAYVVLQDHPLAAGAPGPLVSIDAADVRRYETGGQTRQSNLRVQAGEVLSERQALEALLLPSANNIAYALARWDAGSTTAFLDRMNAAAARLGLRHTRYTDPSGYEPATVSTAREQTTLALHAMQDPAFAAIVAEQQAELPLVGRVRNRNTLLGGETVGVKTGSTLPAGGCVVLAARVDVAGSSHVLVATVLGQRGPVLLDAALAAGRQLERSAEGAVRLVRLPVGTRVGLARLGHRSIAITTGAAVDVLAWPGVRLHVVARVDERCVGTSVGTAKLVVGDVASTVALDASSLVPAGARCVAVASSVASTTPG
jgi:D-alanyl-D-alanine carboxypeptidase (penicillin-binding protein 5/6)